MPAIVGPVQVFNVADGNLLFGDAAVISPKSSNKTVTGSGSANTGGIVFTASGLNGNNILDINGVDQPISGNN
ncbi:MULTISPECIES: spore germination protein [Peribacillus]|uniref:spore germination protein n=1 Tax=Peribacillus TaxID=2675229 RepID=UPI001911F2ED|nr:MULTISPECIES: spore germination protein [unclassified Peribacillus]MBK5445472.1 spore germination protein [Peribacillus sp. TH24]MBK5459806.1 spore germination protein [Peribacillus sp. TH27]MBK5481615.1 spore germination protein [Peribacillus sp. TH16]MBK5497996.1 spore germination protein [Peribacillus sp. TH14]WMX56890.1 spore germination protein [Peribacillus sp. R9-11]